MSVLVPRRRRGREILDDPNVDTETRLRSLGDVTRSNALFGGRRAAVTAVAGILPRQGTVSVLDVGTGLADIPATIVRLAAARGVRVVTIGLDESVELLRSARGRLSAVSCGTVTALPFRDASVDVVVCSQLLHHFADDALADVVRELDRVARLHVVIADIRRSWLAAAGFWLASFPLGFHRVTRHDGVVSVFRGFSAPELVSIVKQATGVTPTVRRRLGFRLTATWTPRAV